MGHVDCLDWWPCATCKHTAERHRVLPARQYHNGSWAPGWNQCKHIVTPTGFWQEEEGMRRTQPMYCDCTNWVPMDNLDYLRWAAEHPAVKE